ncbi:aflatoxin biosynthesis ketoreductase-like protein nor-1 [Mycena crocata]|nr:aflatoxin biosynthesis ketoreductase-like protein nor-1 [Mycena crocata]
MSAETKTVYLISGANRGIGHGLAAALAARPNTIVFAGAREPKAESLKDLSARHPNVYALKLTSGDQMDNEAAIAEIQRTAGHLDVIIANAGISTHYGPLATTPLPVLREHWEVNTLGPVVLFQAAHTLLLASPTGIPTFALISSAAGSIASFISLSAATYGSSKAGANFLIKALAAEHSSLIAFAIAPGWVATDMGNRSARANGLDGAPVSIDESVAGILARIDGATVEKSSGRFWSFRDSGSGEISW